jgi:RNA polymerase sigma factor (sigma-70 family)
MADWPSTSLITAPTDEELVRLAVAGESDALETLLRRHQRWLYDVAFRVLQSTADAEDATQESLLKVATRLATFRGESAFRTWAYRIAMRHLLDRRRSRPELSVASFDCYGDYLARAHDEEPADLAATPADAQLIVEEAKQTCLLGMLLCLRREQRLVFVLGDLLDVSDTLGAEVLDLSPDNFRQRLSRARRQLVEFAQGHCGLVDAGNRCRCARKTRAFIRDGIVDPRRLLFARPHLKRMEELASGGRGALERAVESAGIALWREQLMPDPPDLVTRLRSVLSSAALRAAMQLS